MRPFLTLRKFLLQDWDACLDIGSGDGVFTQLMHNNGRHVIEIDINPHSSTVVSCDYQVCNFATQFDAIWCSHVLEHQLNVNSFLTKIHKDLKEGGWLAITVPPMKPNIVGGHLTIWNAGLLLYNLILAGFDCRDAMVKTYDYNVSVVVQSKHIKLPKLKYDSGDIETLSEYFPLDIAKQDFNGDIKEINW